MTPQAQVIVITGAAGHLGRAVTKAFLQRGAAVILLDRTAPRLQDEYGDRSDVVVSVVDLMDRDSVKEAVSMGQARYQRIDVLCHIAGGFRMGEPVHETSLQNWDFLMDLNARSLLNIAAAVVPSMQQQGSGQIVTVGAGAAIRGGARMGAYSASKSALIRLTEAMSAELKAKDINVNCVLPSIIDTPENRSAMPDAQTSDWVAPDALADVILFLASPAARAIHGASIPVAGKV